MSDDRVYRASIDQLMVQIKQSALANIFLMTVVGGFTWWNSSDNSVAAWILIGYVVTLTRFPVFDWILRQDYAGTSYKWLEASVFIALFLSGLHWGMVVFLYLDFANIQLSIFLIFAILGVVCATLASLTIRPMIWFGFTASAFGLTILKLILVENWGLAAMGIGLTTFLTFVGRNLGKRIQTSITQDFRNADLLEEVSEAKEAAEHANLKKSMFMAATSHDLRQPLHAQSLLLDALTRQVKEPSTQTLVKKIINSNEALISLFNSLLEVSQLDAGTVKVYKASHSLTKLCDQLIDEFRELAAQKNISLIFNKVDCIVHTDPVLLARIIRNLLSNAIKFTQKGNVTISIKLQSDDALLTISDTGTGIPENQFDLIFDEYTQLGNKTRDRSNGIGLGLAVVRKLSHLLEHSIELQSQMGNGSSFILMLPIGYDEEVSENIIEENTMDAIQNVRVLLLDDEQPILDAMNTVLADWSCQARGFTNYEDAATYLSDTDFKPDLILSDYRLSDGITGVEAVELLRRKLGTKTPAILISGDTDPKLLERLQQEDFYLLHKPVKPAKLRRVMGILVSREAA